MDEIKKTSEIFEEKEEEKLPFQKVPGEVRKTADIFGEDPLMPTPSPTPTEKEYPWYSLQNTLGLLYRTAGGLAGSFASKYRALDKATLELAKLGERVTGIPKEKLRGGIFEILQKDAERLSQEFHQKGAKGVFGEVMAGLGGALVDIPSIMTFGKWGLPIHGAVMGAAEEGKKGAVLGALQGALVHKVIQGIGLLPSVARLPAWGGFGAVATPGDIKEKTAGGITWSILGMSGGAKKLTIREFAQNYPKVQEKVGEWKAVGMLKKLAPDVTVEEMKKAGGAKVVLEEVVRELNKIPEPEIKATKDIEFAPTPKATPKQIKTRMKQLDEMILEATPEAKPELQRQRLALSEQLQIMEKPVEKRMPSYPGFPKDAPDVWFRVMERGGIARPKYEVEEYETNVPRQLRRSAGMKPDDMAARLGFEDTEQLYRALEPTRVERVTEKPEEVVRLELEEFLSKENLIKTEESILRETGYKDPEIEKFISHEFLDGKQLRATAEDVLQGKIKRADAVAEIKDLIKSVTGKEPPKPELFEQKLIEKRIEETPSQQELKAEGTESALVGLPLKKEAILFKSNPNLDEQVHPIRDSHLRHITVR